MPNNILSTLQQYLIKQLSPDKAEFGAASAILLRKRMMWRFQTQEQRTKDVNKFINGLSDFALQHNLDMVLLQVNTSKAECQKYSDAKQQFKNVIQRLPRLAQFSNRTLEHIKKERRRHKVGNSK